MGMILYSPFRRKPTDLTIFSLHIVSMLHNDRLTIDRCTSSCFNRQPQCLFLLRSIIRNRWFDSPSSPSEWQKRSPIPCPWFRCWAGSSSSDRAVSLHEYFFVKAEDVAKRNLIFYRKQLPKKRSVQIWVNRYSLEDSLAQDNSEQNQQLGWKLLIDVFVPLELVHHVVSIAKLKHTRGHIEHFLDYQMHPLPQQSTRIVHLVSHELDLYLLEHVNLFCLVKTRHQHVVPVDFHVVCSVHPGDAEPLEMVPEPCGLLLKGEVSDLVRRHIEKHGLDALNRHFFPNESGTSLVQWLLSCSKTCLEVEVVLDVIVIENLLVFAGDDYLLLLGLAGLLRYIFGETDSQVVMNLDGVVLTSICRALAPNLSLQLGH